MDGQQCGVGQGAVGCGIPLRQVVIGLSLPGRTLSIWQWTRFHMVVQLQRPRLFLPGTVGTRSGSSARNVMVGAMHNVYDSDT